MEAQNWVVYSVEGAACKSPLTLFEEFVSSLDFSPNMYVNNWNAFDEVMRDIPVAAGRSDLPDTLVVIQNSEKVLFGNDLEIQEGLPIILMSTIETYAQDDIAGERWDRAAIGFAVLFITDPQNVQSEKQRWQSLGLKYMVD